MKSTQNIASKIKKKFFLSITSFSAMLFFLKLKIKRTCLDNQTENAVSEILDTMDWGEETIRSF